MDTVQQKIEEVSQVLQPLLEDAADYAKKNPLQAAAIAGGSVAAGYGLSFLFNLARSPRPNIRMVSIRKQVDSGAPVRPLLVFIHGWPDLPDSWGNVINEVYNEYDCLLIELPNFNMGNMELSFLFGDDPIASRADERVARAYPNDCEITYHISNEEKGIIASVTDCSLVPWNAYNRNNWGWPMSKVVDAIIAAIGNYVLKFRRDDTRVSLVLHDWGSLLGLSIYETFRLQKNGHTKDTQKFEIDRIAAIDVADTFKPRNSREMVSFMRYQARNLGLFLSPLGVVANVYGYLTSRGFGSPLVRQGRFFKYFDIRVNYLYYWMWTERFYGNLFFLIGAKPSVLIKKGGVPDVATFHAVPDPTPAPGRLRWHSTKWEHEIKSKASKQKYKGLYKYQTYENGFHWLHYGDESVSSKVINDLKDWLQETKGKNVAMAK